MSIETMQRSKPPNRQWKVLVVDDDRTCLMILEKMLQHCNFKVTTSRYAKEALSMVQERRNEFDVVIIDVHMPDVNGFEFLKRISLEMDLPVIMMSSDDDEDLIRKGFLYGACDYLIKPIRIESVRHLWKHVYRVQRHGWGTKRMMEQSGSNSNIIVDELRCGDQYICASSEGEDHDKTMKKRKPKYENDNVYTKDNNEEVGDPVLVNDDGTRRRKKQRVIWTPKLHEKFVAAVNEFGTAKAVPKKILETMNVPGLTRENVASHLQKYRQYLKRLEQNLQQKGDSTITTTPSSLVQSRGFTRLNLGSQNETSKLDHLQNQALKTNALQQQQIVPFHDHRHQRQTLAVQTHVLANENGVALHNGDYDGSSKIELTFGGETSLNHYVEGGNNMAYHPVASYSFSTIDSKFHLVETPWSTTTAFSLEGTNVKSETEFFVVGEMTTSMGEQSCGIEEISHGRVGSINAYENMLHLAYNDTNFYIEQINQSDYIIDRFKQQQGFGHMF